MSDSRSNLTPAFTIVELLVVIVVIGILATITIVSYTGITQRATTASLQSDLDSSSKLLKMYQVEHGAFPTSFDANNCPLGAVTPSPDTRYCLKSSSGTTYDFHSGNSQTFCITAQNETRRYKITNDSLPSIGDCLGYNLVGYWPMDGAGLITNGQTSNLQDLSGNNNNGTASNANGTGMTFTIGKIGSALSFDGVDDSVAIGNATSIKVASSDHTIEFWAIVNNLSTTQGILGASTSGASSGDYQIWIYYNSLTYFRGNGSSYESVTMTPAPPTGSWIHCAIVISGNNAQWYMNGEKKGSSILNLTPTATSPPKIIGALTTTSFPMNGYIDNFRIYNRALSANEIGAIYDATKQL